ncbi:glycosyltransferase family 1 protein [Halorubrum sp. SD690R]|uniref:glycosyltransferase family 4 protein n=1 Tax=Halorubrum sp. SD690R TaxID=2518117 RepID=UPI0010F49A2E|nr:glycosyltransferase family 4 protein [Halorubrum sp. SD690R]TKX47740.1 glycosyltransferase family 1 protein [Halorubrum sp. SD690R]
MTDSGVCVVTHPLSAAGENATRTLLNVLAELGPVSLVTADLPADSTIREDREVVELTQKETGDSVPVAAVRFILNQLRMCVAIGRRPEETILFFGATAYLLPILFSRSIGKTVFVEPRGDVPLTLRLTWEQRMPDAFAAALAGSVRLLERIGFLTAHTVVTYTPNMARELGLDPDSPRVYAHGARYVDTEAFRPEIPFEERDTVVGFVGRLDEEKGIRELAAVASRLPDGLTFRFVGDGPLHEWLESELTEEIEDGTVELAGWVDHDDVPAELTRMKLLVMPSQPTEGLPTTILEAMACGTPVYATPVSGVPDVVLDDETGFTMREDDHEEMARRVVSALESKELNEMSRRCRELIETEYSFDAAVRRYQRLLKKES